MDVDPYVKRKIQDHVGYYLGWRATDPRYSNKASGEWQFEYLCDYIIDYPYKTYRSPLVQEFEKSSHWKVNGVSNFANISYWHQPLGRSQMDTPALPDGQQGYGDFVPSERRYFETRAISIAYNIYIELATPMVNGQKYEFTDIWDNQATVEYNDTSTQSWAIKVNQTGYVGDVVEKYGFIGAWLGVRGAWSFDYLNGTTFHLRRTSDDVSVYNNTIQLDKEEFLVWDSEAGARCPSTGEGNVYKLDFSAYTTSGEYYLHVPNVGRSWIFPIGTSADIIGPSFYKSIRGVFHQRCAVELKAPQTNWPRKCNDTHYDTRKGNWLPDAKDDNNASSRTNNGWGWFYASGGAAGNMNSRRFQSVASAGESAPSVPNVHGGWHDAADHDKRPMHHEVVLELVNAYIMFPNNFTDNQLNLPESGDGVPDILSEAIHGLNYMRLAQIYFGNGSTTDGIESWRHPLGSATIDEDVQWLASPNRMSTLRYSNSAAALAYALSMAGRSTESTLWKNSAEWAYDWCHTQNGTTFTSYFSGNNFRWIDPPRTDSEFLEGAFDAEVSLLRLTGDSKYYNKLNTSWALAHYNIRRFELNWNTKVYYLMFIALYPEIYPSS